MHHLVFYAKVMESKKDITFIGLNTLSLPQIPPENTFESGLSDRPVRFQFAQSAMKAFPQLPYVLKAPIQAVGEFEPLQVFVKRHGQRLGGIEATIV
jgi:hypothetical protein